MAIFKRFEGVLKFGKWHENEDQNKRKKGEMKLKKKRQQL